MQKETTLKYFLFAYILLLPTNRLLQLPIVGQKLQLPEIVFLLLLLYLLLQHQWKKILPGKLHALDYGVGILLASYFLLGLIHGTRNTWLEVVGLFYLGTVYVVFRGAIISLEGTGKLFLEAVRGMGWVCVATVVFTLLMQGFYPANGLELVEPKYIPAWGYVDRVMGFCTSPNMLASLLGMALLMEISRLLFLPEREKRDFFRIGVFLLAFVPTFSKSIVLVMAGFGVLVFLKREWRLIYRIPFLLASIGLLGFFLFTTQFLKMPVTEQEAAVIVDQTYATSEVVEVGSSQFVKTINLELKEQALAAFRERPLFGIGPGQFRAWLAERQEEGEYPADKPIYDPHSLYLGMLAEGGVLGAVALGAFLLLLGLDFPFGSNEVLWKGVGVVILVMLVEGWAMDVLNFRQFWLMVGDLGGGVYLKLIKR